MYPADCNRIFNICEKKIHLSTRNFNERKKIQGWLTNGTKYGRLITVIDVAMFRVIVDSCIRLARDLERRYIFPKRKKKRRKKERKK